MVKGVFEIGIETDISKAIKGIEGKFFRGTYKANKTQKDQMKVFIKQLQRMKKFFAGE